MRDDHTGRIVPLDELPDFEVAARDPDVRGWEVIGADGQRIGEVDQLLVDMEALKVRYLDVDLAGSTVDAGDDRHVLVPIGYASLDRTTRQVIVDAVTAEELRRLPAYNHQTEMAEYENELLSSLHDGDGDADVRRMIRSEEELAVGKREHRAGEVLVEKEVDTRHVREIVPVVREEVTIERRPARPGMEAHAGIEDQEIRVPVHEEELVVSKRTVPREEIVVRKREVVENEAVEADLRRERVDIEPEGNARVRNPDGSR